MKAVKRSIAICVLTLIMCVSLLVGITFAWFTDTITNSGNIILAGNLSIGWQYRSSDSAEDLSDVTEDTALFSETALWQPGGSQSYVFVVSNTGSLPLDWKLTLENVQTSGAADLTDLLTITVGETVTKFESGAVIANGTNLAAESSSGEFTVTVSFSSAAGDMYQGAGVSFNLVLAANQVGLATGFNASISSGTTSVG